MFEDMKQGYGDGHSCRAHATDFGICTWCGAIIHGSLADYELCGYDPPEIDRDYIIDWSNI